MTDPTYSRCLAFLKVHGVARGLAGCTEATAGDYRIAFNPHDRACSPSWGGPGVPAKHLIIAYKGMPFACINDAGGLCIEIPGASERGFMDAVDAEEFVNV